MLKNNLENATKYPFDVDKINEIIGSVPEINNKKVISVTSPPSYYNVILNDMKKNLDEWKKANPAQLSSPTSAAPTAAAATAAAPTAAAAAAPTAAAAAAPTAAAAAAPTAAAAAAPTAAAAAAPTAPPTKQDVKYYEKAVLYYLLIEHNIYDKTTEGRNRAKIALWSNVTEPLSEEDKRAALRAANLLITKFYALPNHEKDFLKEFYKKQVEETNNEIWNGVITEKREADALKFDEIVKKANQRVMRNEEEREEERRRPLTQDEILLNDLERKRAEGVAAGEDVADIQGQIEDVESRISVSVSDRAPPPQPTPPQSPPPQSQSPPPPISSSSSDTDEREETEETDSD